jgi:hypothetical protein
MIIIVGSDCIKKFCPPTKKCDKCGIVHRNRVVNRCNECRIGICDKCDKPCKNMYNKCFKCYTNRKYNNCEKCGDKISRQKINGNNNIQEVKICETCVKHRCPCGKECLNKFYDSCVECGLEPGPKYMVKSDNYVGKSIDYLFNNNIGYIAHLLYEGNDSHAKRSIITYYTSGMIRNINYKISFKFGKLITRDTYLIDLLNTNPKWGGNVTSITSNILKIKYPFVNNQMKLLKNTIRWHCVNKTPLIDGRYLIEIHRNNQTDVSQHVRFNT